MSEYFQRLLRRMNQPSATGLKTAPPLVPFVGSMNTAAQEYDPFEMAAEHSEDAPIDATPPSTIQEMVQTVAPMAATQAPVLQRPPVGVAHPSWPSRFPPDAPAPRSPSALAPVAEEPSRVAHRLTDSQPSVSQAPALSSSSETIIVEKETLTTPDLPEPFLTPPGLSEVGRLLPASDTPPPEASQDIFETFRPETITQAVEQATPENFPTPLSTITSGNELTPPPAKPTKAQSLQPSVPQAPPLNPPQPKEPRLVIGRLSVEVLPSPPVSAGMAPSQARPAPRARPRSQRSQTVRSKLRFGLGQL